MQKEVPNNYRENPLRWYKEKLQGMTIGNGVTLGANSVLMTQPKDDSTYLGVPAMKFDF